MGRRCRQNNEERKYQNRMSFFDLGTFGIRFHHFQFISNY